MKKRIESILELIQTPEVQQLWNTSKDHIGVCKVCEYRYMCVDPRVPVKRENGSFYFESECAYNPYIGLWDFEPGYKTLAECGIVVNESE